MSRDTVVGRATGCGMYDRGVKVRVQVVTKFSVSPLRSDRFWGLPSFLFNGYRGGGEAFPGGEVAGA
jgi:hypothetical protein